MAGSRPHPRDIPDDETTIILTSRYDQESDLRKLRELARHMSPREVRELFYDSKHGTVHKRMHKTMEWEPLPFEELNIQIIS